MPRMLGDLYPATNPDDKLDAHDVDEYTKAIQLNTTHSMWDNVEDPSDPSKRVNVLIDPENGGLIYDQYRVASLHKTGFISNIDKMLLQSYIDSGTTEVSLKGYIDGLDSKEVVPPPDPTDTKTLAELREYIVTTVQTLVIFQAQKFLELQKTAPSSLHDIQQKMARVWSDAYAYDYDTAAQIDANLKTGLETDGSSYPDDDGHRILPQNMYNSIVNIIAGSNPLSKTQLDNIVSKYWVAGAITISDPPTIEEQTKVIEHIWNETGVEKGISFYNEWKDVSPEPEPGPTPTSDLVPEIPSAAPLTGDLAAWVSASANEADFNAIVNTQHPHQIVTVSFQSGVTNASQNKNVDIHCWQYKNGSWGNGPKYSYTSNCFVGGGYDSSTGTVFGGIYPVNQLNEGTSGLSCRTPAGAFQLGNYTTNTDEVGAFGVDTAWGSTSPKLNYRVINTSNMHWIDADGRAGLPNWYNMFANCDGNRVLIQYKRTDWDTGVSGGVTDKAGNNYSTNTTPFKYGQFYTVSGLVDDASYTENLSQYVKSGGAYEHAIVIRFNMPPHVSVPVMPGNAGAGSAYFLHSSTGSNTAGCVSAPDAAIKEMLQWLDRSENPYIFIRLPN